MGRFLICCAILAALAGCEAYNGTTKALRPPIPAVTGLIILDGVSVINTQKTIDDHLVSLITGLDCSTVRASKGGHYCVEETPEGPIVMRTTYCYKSIAKVSCYAEPLNSDASMLYGIRVDRIPASDILPAPVQPAVATARPIAAAQPIADHFVPAPEPVSVEPMLSEPLRTNSSAPAGPTPSSNAPIRLIPGP